MKKGYNVLFLATISAFALMVGGIYLIIDNIIEPKELLFEGITCFSLGFILLMTISLINSIKRAIELFTIVYDQQADIHLKVVNEINARHEMTLANIAKSYHPNRNNRLEDMTVKQLSDELKKALSVEDFEKATEIRNLIKKKNNPGKSSPDEES